MATLELETHAAEDLEEETQAAIKKIVELPWDSEKKRHATTNLSDDVVKRLRDVPSNEFAATLEALLPEGTGAAATVTSGVEAKIDELAKSQAELVKSHAKVVHLLESKAVLQYSFSGSRTGKSKAIMAALKQLNLKGDGPGELPTPWPPGYDDYIFTEYPWPPDVSEEKDSGNLQEHFAGELRKLKVPLKRGGFQVLDVRGQHKLSFECSPGATALAFNGGTDAAVTPFGVRAWAAQICIAIDWKTPNSLKSLKDYDILDDEMKLELLGALHNSERPTMVVCTDLINFFIYVPIRKEIQYYHTFGSPGDAGHISTSDAMRLIAHFLTVVSPKERTFDWQDLAAAPAESVLGQLAMPLLTAKKLAGAGEGLAEQLQLVQFYPPEQQFEAASQLILAWRHELEPPSYIQ